MKKVLSLEELKEIIDRNFSAPFLQEGLVVTECYIDPDTEGTSLGISIGRRSIVINSNGEVESTGTFISGPVNPFDVGYPT